MLQFVRKKVFVELVDYRENTEWEKVLKMGDIEYQKFGSDEVLKGWENTEIRFSKECEKGNIRIMQDTCA